MKFIISAPGILLLSSSGILANASLPPGYDTNMHCPPGSCSLYIPHPKAGFAGPKRAFYKCYDESTDEMTEALWTGDRTEIIEAPQGQGWIQDPAECDIDTAPNPAKATPPKNIDTPGGLCVTDSDCHVKIRGAAPPNAIGPHLCECYATSTRLPFDETEGQATNTNDVRRARCDPGACDGFEPYCPLAPNDNGMAECALRPIDTSSTSSASAPDVSPRPYPKTKKRPNTNTSTRSTSTSPTKKRKPAQYPSKSTSSSHDSSSTGIVSPTPAPPAQARLAQS